MQHSNTSKGVFKLVIYNFDKQTYQLGCTVYVISVLSIMLTNWNVTFQPSWRQSFSRPHLRYWGCVIFVISLELFLTASVPVWNIYAYFAWFRNLYQILCPTTGRGWQRTIPYASSLALQHINSCLLCPSNSASNTSRHPHAYTSLAGSKTGYTHNHTHTLKIQRGNRKQETKHSAPRPIITLNPEA